MDLLNLSQGKIIPLILSFPMVQTCQYNPYCKFRQWWWSSGQRACLLLRRSEFEFR